MIEDPVEQVEVIDLCLGTVLVGDQYLMQASDEGGIHQVEADIAEVVDNILQPVSVCLVRVEAECAQDQIARLVYGFGDRVVCVEVHTVTLDRLFALEIRVIFLCRLAGC